MLSLCISACRRCGKREGGRRLAQETGEQAACCLEDLNADLETVGGLGSATSLVVGEVCRPGVSPKTIEVIFTNQRTDHLSLSSPIRSGLIEMRGFMCS